MRLLSGILRASPLFALLAPPALAAGGPMSFSFNLSLSPKAAALLAEKKERIIVWSSWWGEPTKAAKKYADEVGQIALGQERVTLTAAGGAGELTGRKVAVNHIDRVKDRAVQVWINVYTARLSGPDNLLNCDIFEDSLLVARAKPIAIACKLIGEN